MAQLDKEQLESIELILDETLDVYFETRDDTAPSLEKHREDMELVNNIMKTFGVALWKQFGSEQ